MMRSRHQSHDAPGVVIVGAGLVGCVLAIHLARRGIRVTIYERNPDCRTKPAGRRPALSLSLCTRGIQTLEAIGVMDRIRKLLAPAAGRMIHARDGSVSFQPYSPFGEAIHCVSRRALSAALLDAAEDQAVAIRFERRCVDVDAASGAIAVEDAGGLRTRVRAPAILAADGSFSTVRRELQRGGWCRYSLDISRDGYKAFRIPSSGAVAMGLRADALHGWPRPSLLAGAFPEPDGSFAGTLHMSLTGPISFESVSDRFSIAVLFENECPVLTRAVPGLVEDLARQRPNSLVTVTCRPWSAAGKVLLIGDAAHAMLPYYGQGANAGFEDCETLDNLIGRYGTDWARVFVEFEAVRRTDVGAMADLCREHLGVLRDDVSRPDFQARWSIEQQLHRVLPDLCTPLYAMTAFSSMSYAEACRRDRWQRSVIRDLLRDAEIARRLVEPVWPEALLRQIRSRLAAACPPRAQTPTPSRTPCHSRRGREKVR